MPHTRVAQWVCCLTSGNL